MDKIKSPVEDSSLPSHQAESCDPAPEHNSIAPLLKSIAAEFDLVMGNPARVETLCSQLRKELHGCRCEVRSLHLQSLLPLLRKQMGLRAEPLFFLIREEAAQCPEPWPFLEGMLVARDQGLALNALDLTVSRAGSGSLSVTRQMALSLAAQVEKEESPFTDAAALQKISIVVHLLPSPDPGIPDPVAGLFLHEPDNGLRRLAARILDLKHPSAMPALAEQLLGTEAYKFLRPYLDYTCATHLDLLHIVPSEVGVQSMLEDLRKAEEICGDALLGNVIAEIGWKRMNLGLEIRPLVGISIAGSLPLVLSPFEAPLFECHADARHLFEYSLFIGHGGQPESRQEEIQADNLVARFRGYNLAHAEALGDILDMAPLTHGKVNRILLRMDRIVKDYAALFSAYSDEVAILPELYQNLRRKIVEELEKEVSHPQLSAELTRLVQMFEDPPSLGRVRTLHGLKRYLHQKGLKLGMKLVQAGRATNRTVDLVITSRRRVLRSLRAIQYVDFEPGKREEGRSAGIPYPVAALANALSRQWILGQESFPNIKIFCYGNEVHYYLSFRNHPALLRIDYSAPLQGGMIDLEYYGVSKYELSLHPNPSLDAIRTFFRHLEFDAQVESTRIHARYDKERAIDLVDLCEKAEALFALIPYLMDVDWVIGGLCLGEEARRAVAEGWAERFALWGVLPISQLLTKDRQAVLSGYESGPGGEQELAWTGEAPYRDRFSLGIPPEYLELLRTKLEELGLHLAAMNAGAVGRAMGQVGLERCFLTPLRNAIARGELVASPEGPRRCSPDLFQRLHEAERFASLLDSSDERLASAVALAEQLVPLERSLFFQTTGSVNGYEVQSTRLALRNEHLSLFVLRDAAGIIRLALFTLDEGLWRRRQSRDHPWEFNESCDAASLIYLLRRSNYPVTDTASSLKIRPSTAATIRGIVRKQIGRRYPAPQPGERIIHGLRAAPGRAVGIALFGTEGRQPIDFAGAILVAPSVRPEDSAILYQSTGIVSTGGGVLSHAGLIAMQFRKPALIISGQWQGHEKKPVSLLYRMQEFREQNLKVQDWHVTLRTRILEQEHELREGDLVVLDADEGILRVLGQNRETIGLHESFQLYSEASRRLGQATDPKEILILRGWRSRARHQIGKLLARLHDPTLAGYAIHEILLGKVVPDEVTASDEKAQLLSPVLGNRALGTFGKEYLTEIAKTAEQHFHLLFEKARESIPTSSTVYEILALRIETLRRLKSLREISLSLRKYGFEGLESGFYDPHELDRISRRRLVHLRRELRHDVEKSHLVPSGTFRARQLESQIARIDTVLGPAAERKSGAPDRWQNPPGHSEAEIPRCRGSGYVLWPLECGFEVSPLIGWKAANLAEAERIGGSGLIPPWFVVTHRVFEELLDAPLDRIFFGREALPSGAHNLREAITEISEHRDLDNVQKSAQIRGLWDRISLSREQEQEVLSAYHRLSGLTPGNSVSEADLALPFLAIRSSAREEDAEIAARAGEFDTFLFIRGERPFLDYLKRAWSGLWTERAIHNRAILESSGGRAGGGILVQRIVSARVSGVLHTVSVAEREMREMVINVGLGLGEGIVSGQVAADQIMVEKKADPEEGPLSFRYVTADKRERVVFNKRLGMGTVREETLYHQRLRPALEYVELVELVRTALFLEAAYGYPLDIEFAIEGTRLWILQVRPVAIFLSLLNETLDQFPLEKTCEEDQGNSDRLC